MDALIHFRYRIFTTPGGLQPTGSCFISLLENNVENCCYPPHGQMDSKVEAYVQSQHIFYLLSIRDNGPVAQGRCCVQQPCFSPCKPNAIRGVSSKELRHAFTNVTATQEVA